MKTYLVTLLAFLLMLTAVSFASLADDGFAGSHLNFDTIEKLPRPLMDINVPTEGKAKLLFKFVFQPAYSYQLIDYQKVIDVEPHYHLLNYHLLRAKSYFLMI